MDKKKLIEIRHNLDNIQRSIYGYIEEMDKAITNDAPAPAPPYEMLGKVFIEKAGSRLPAQGGQVLYINDFCVARIYCSKDDFERLKRLLHEHSCDREALEWMRINGLQASLNLSDSVMKEATAILACLNAGPVKP